MKEMPVMMLTLIALPQWLLFADVCLQKRSRSQTNGASMTLLWRKSAVSSSSTSSCLVPPSAAPDQRQERRESAGAEKSLQASLKQPIANTQSRYLLRYTSKDWHLEDNTQSAQQASSAPTFGSTVYHFSRPLLFMRFL